MNRPWNAISWVVLATTFFVAVPIQAAIIYVDKDNSCPGSGTSASPYCSIQNAVYLVNAGDTIRIRDAATPYNETILTTRSGRSGAPITVEPDVGHNPTLRNSRNGAQCATFWIRDADYWTIRNLNFDASGQTPCVFGAIMIHATIRNTFGHQIIDNRFKGWGGPAHTGEPAARGMTAIMINGGALDANQGFWPTGTIVRGNTFEGNRLISLTLLHSDGTIVESNEFKNATCGRDTDGAVNEIGIKAAFHNKNMLVKGNHIHDFAAHSDCMSTNQLYATWAGFWCDVGGNTTTIEKNIIYNIDQNGNNFSNPLGFSKSSQAFHIESRCRNYTVRNNVIYKIGTEAIKNRQSSYEANGRNKYYNNTIYSVGMYGIRVTELGGIEAKNNIIANSGLRAMQFEGTAATPANHLINYNLYYNDASGKIATWGSESLDFATWKSRCSCDANTLNTPPLLVNPIADLGLQSSSPARSSGENGSDMGAFPYDGSSLPLAPTLKSLIVQ